jgi:hypothetical protein
MTRLSPRLRKSTARPPSPGFSRAISSFSWGGIDINNVGDLITVMNAHDVGDVVGIDIIQGNQRLSGQTMLEKVPSVQLPPSQRTL